MNFQDIRKLVKLVESSGVDRLEIEEEGLRIEIEKHGSSVAAVTGAPVPVTVPAPVAPVPTSAPAPAAETEPAEEEGYTVRSPMVGTFYQAPSPESPPFVKEGDRVSAGQTLCIIEAMKVMNEIESEVAGVVRRVLVENAQPVQFDQPLFIIDPS